MFGRDILIISILGQATKENMNDTDDSKLVFSDFVALCHKITKNLNFGHIIVLYFSQNPKIIGCTLYVDIHII